MSTENIENLDEKGLMKVWLTIWNLAKKITGDVDILNKGDLQTQIDNMGVEVEKCFQSASDGKELLSAAITGKGVETSADATYAEMAENISAISGSGNLQEKKVTLDVETPSVTVIPDEEYGGLSSVTADIKLQEKLVELSTEAQDIAPDNGSVLSKVTIPAVTGTANAAHVLAGETFNSSEGIEQVGTMPNNEAWIGNTDGYDNVPIPEGYHNGKGYVSALGAYTAGKEAGTTESKVGTAQADDVLEGETFTNSEESGIDGSMSNRQAVTVDAVAVTQDDTHTYLKLPDTKACYDGGSIVRALNSDIAIPFCIPKISSIHLYPNFKLTLDTTNYKKMSFTLSASSGRNYTCNIKDSTNNTIANVSAKSDVQTFDISSYDEITIDIVLYANSGDNPSTEGTITITNLMLY